VTATHDQIVFEANRRALERGPGAPPVEHFIIEVVREGWTPPEPVDPDLPEVREIVAQVWDDAGAPHVARGFRSGRFDKDKALRAALAAYKAGKEAAQ